MACRKENESKQQQIETRLSDVERSLAMILDALNASTGRVLPQLDQNIPQEPSLGLVSSPFTNTIGITASAHPVTGEHKLAFPPLPNHTMIAVQNALHSSGVLSECNGIPSHQGRKMCERRPSVLEPMPELQSSTRELHRLGFETISALVDAYHEECFYLYPVVDVAKVRTHMASLFSSPLHFSDNSDKRLSLWNLDILTIIIAIGIQFSDDLQSPLKHDLLSHVHWSAKSSICQDTSAIEDIQISTLLVSTTARAYN